jgi:subfamily B ATP-binding cassette protein MsbA
LFVLLIPTIVFLRNLFSWLNVYLLQWAAVHAVSDLRIKLFNHLMHLPASFFNKTSSGELISRTASDTATLQNVISNMTAVMVKDPVTLVSILAYLLWTERKLTLLSMVVLPVCIFPIAIYSRKVRQASKTIQTHTAKMIKVMAEAFTGYRVVKAYNLEETVTEQFRAVSRDFVSQIMRIVRSSETPGPILEVVGSFGVALLLLYLSFGRGVAGHPADFLKIILAIYSMYRPIKNLTRLQTSLQQARAGSERVFELLAMESSLPEPANPKPLRAAGADIHFDSIEFHYNENREKVDKAEDDEPVLSGINLEIRPGSLLALVGPNGSGKTTLTNLLLRFYDPEKGAVRIGGVDIRDVLSRDLRNQIAVVTQETILFNDTIRANIAVGRPGATNTQIEEAAKHAHAHNFIMEKRQGYDTIVGEKGVSLSGGQRQRIAIARAILRNAPILILDEATSNIDPESEQAIQAAFEDLMQGRTTICIAHRLTTIRKADLIVVMDKGRIKETGTHAELIQSRGLYSKLHDLQFHAAAAA